MKRLLSLLLALLLCAVIALPAFAAEGEPRELVFDTMLVLTDDELAEVNEYFVEVSDEYGIDILLLLLSDAFGEDTISYAENFYAENADLGFLRGDGILFILNKEESEWYGHTAGRASVIFSEDDIDDIWAAYDDAETYYGGAIDLADEVAAKLSARGVQEIPAERKLSRLVDDADLFDASQEAKLLAKLDDISERQQCDVAIITVDSIGRKTATEYADDFYDYNGYGYGADDDGILFLISMEYSDWAISTYGFGITAFTDAGQEKIVSVIKPDLSAGNYYSAFDSFADQCDKYLTQARTGEAYDEGNMPLDSTDVAVYIVIGLIIGAVLAFAIAGGMKGSLKSVTMQAKADSYVRAGSMSITGGNDTFLYRNVARTARPTSSSSGSSGGGSSSHSSSSGRSHGGSSGKF